MSLSTFENKYVGPIGDDNWYDKEPLVSRIKPEPPRQPLETEALKHRKPPLNEHNSSPKGREYQKEGV